MLIRARSLLPITAPPIEDGAVLVSGESLAEVGPWSELRLRHPTATVVDLGDVAVLPGWINAHCHLDYTHLAGHLPPPRSFTDWIQGIIGLKAAWSFSEFAASWVAGARQLLATGCTTVCDFEAVPELLPEAWNATPLRVLSALEITGVRAARPPRDILDGFLAHAENLIALRHPRNHVGLAPHAPYSTLPELLRLTARAAAERGLPITIHVAESAEEDAMFRTADGPMYHWLRPQRVMDDCDGRSPVRVVADAGLLGPSSLLAHVNYPDADDLELLARSGSAVVHCPRSHDYFGHAPFPFAQLRQAGVRVCLGTDSLLTVRKPGRPAVQLDLFTELRTFADRHPEVPASALLALVTSEAALALGRGGQLGSLRAGHAADLIAVPLVDVTVPPEVAVLQHRGPVFASLIAGTWAIAPGATPDSGLDPL